MRNVVKVILFLAVLGVFVGIPLWNSLHLPSPTCDLYVLVSSTTELKKLGQNPPSDGQWEDFTPVIQKSVSNPDGKGYVTYHWVSGEVIPNQNIALFDVVFDGVSDVQIDVVDGRLVPYDIYANILPLPGYPLSLPDTLTTCP